VSHRGLFYVKGSIMSIAGMTMPKHTNIGDAIRRELLRHPDAITAICDRAGVSRGGTFYRWLRDNGDPRLTTAEKLASEMGFEIVLRRIEQ